MSHYLGKWSAKVYEHYLETGESFTCAEAMSKFGDPTTTVSAPVLLESAVLAGYFSRAIQTYGGERVCRYRAIASESRRDSRGRPPKNTADSSYFDGLRRVRSIFELGDVL